MNRIYYESNSLIKLGSDVAEHQSRHRWQTQLLDWAILVLLPLSITVDLLNGLLLLSGSGLPLSLAFKAGILTLVILRLVITDIRISTALLFLLFMCSLAPIRLLLVRGDFSLFFADISFAIRVLFFISFMIYIILTQPNINKAIFTLKVLSVSIAINLALGFLGFGFPTYSAADGFGVKGFIFSGNELAITIISLSYFVMFCWVKDKPWLVQMLALLAVLGCAGLVATKSAMLGAILIVGLYLFLNSRKTFITAICLTILLIVLFAAPLGAFIKESGLIDRFIFVYTKRGLLSLIFSSREAFFFTNLQFTLENFGLFGWFLGWGQGAYEGFVKPAIEIDIFDMFFAFGITGIIAYVVYFYLIYRLLAIRNKFTHIAPLTIWILIFAVSFFAGHVVYSGLAAIPLTLALYVTKHR